MKKYCFKFSLYGRIINFIAEEETLGKALDIAVKELNLVNETFSLVVIPLGAVKGSYVDVVV